MNKTLIAIVIILLVSVIIGAVIIIVSSGGGGGGAKISGKAGETVLISKDAGETWERAGISKTFNTGEIFLSRNYPGRVFVLTAKNGVWVKERDSEEWKELASLKIIKGSLLYFLTEDKEDNLYASFYSDRRGRVVKYNFQSGAEEEIYHTPLEGYGVFGIWVSSNGKVLRLNASDGGFYESQNSGYAWRVLRRFKEGLLGMTVDSQRNILWLTNSKGRILKTADGGRSWEDISAGLEKFDKADNVENLVFDERSRFLYLASGHGLLRSFNGDGGWEVLPLLLPPEALPIKAAAVDPTDQNVIYAGSKNQFYKSEDNGNSWRIITLPTNRQISRIAVDLIDSEKIYVGLE